MVQAFAAHGALVDYVELADEAAATLCAGIEAGGHPPPFYRRVDATAVESLRAAIREFAETSGGLHALVNNVANHTRHDPLHTTPENWRSRMAVNLDSTFFATQAAIELMRAAGAGGAIVNLSSINALLGPENMPDYVTAKAGLLGLTKALARQYGRDGIRVTLSCRDGS